MNLIRVILDVPIIECVSIKLWFSTYAMLPCLSRWVKWGLYPTQINAGVILDIKIDDLQNPASLPGIDDQVYSVVAAGNGDTFRLVEVEGLYITRSDKRRSAANAEYMRTASVAARPDE